MANFILIRYPVLTGGAISNSILDRWILSSTSSVDDDLVCKLLRGRLSPQSHHSHVLPWVLLMNLHEVIEWASKSSQQTSFIILTTLCLFGMLVNGSHYQLLLELTLGQARFKINVDKSSYRVNLMDYRSAQENFMLLKHRI